MNKPIRPKNVIAGSKNTPLIHPETQEEIFGYIPKMISRGVIIDAGPIILRTGHHKGPNKGFGANHIWYEHSDSKRLKDLIKEGFSPVEAVIHYVAGIVQPGNKIYCEFNSTKGRHRPTVLHGSAGFAVLEPFELGDGETVYSVITAYPKGVASGTLIGEIKKAP